MRPAEWQRSAYLSFGVRLNMREEADCNARVRLLEYVRVDGDCWISTKRTLRLGSKQIGVARAAHALMIEPIPQGADVMTTCGNPSCIYHTTIAVKQREKAANSAT